LAQAAREMPYNPNLAGSWGRSHSFGRGQAAKGVTRKARADEIALSKFSRTEGEIGTFQNASENPNAPPVVVQHGHHHRPIKYPVNPTPRHHLHESHKEDRAGMTSSLPDITKLRGTVEMCEKLPDPQVKESHSLKKHGWYHPLGRKYQDMLTLNQGPRSWAADIRQSHNHIGYGDGIIGYGDVQKTAISSDFPEFGSGLRTVPGPYGTQGLKGDRVGRFPKPIISNGTMRTLVPSYKRGPNLSIVENYYDPDDPMKTERSAAGSSTKSEYGWQEKYYGTCGNQQRQHGQAQFRAGISYMSTMHGGGCVPGRKYIAPSNYIEKDPVIHQHA